MTTPDVPDEEQCPAQPEAKPQPAAARIAMGIGLCLLIAAVAVLLGTWVPIVGAPVFGILLGILIANVFSIPKTIVPGVKFCSKKVLQYAIIALGGSLSLVQVAATGGESAAVMLVTLCSALGAAWILGRLLKVDRNLTSLVGVGTGICGGSAIAAVAPIIQADDDEIAFSISTVFMFNVIAVVIFPLLGHLMQMSDTGFGLWAGTAINDTSSVVAAAFSYSKEAGEYATITKLARTTMIVPICLGIAFLVSRRRCEQTSCDLKKIMPWFILGFLALSLLNTVGVLGPVAPQYFGKAGKLLIVIALAGVGLGADLRKMIRTGPRPLILGLLVWITVSVTSLVVQYIARQL